MLGRCWRAHLKGSQGLLTSDSVRTTAGSSPACSAYITCNIFWVNVCFFGCPQPWAGTRCHGDVVVMSRLQVRAATADYREFN